MDGNDILQLKNIAYVNTQMTSALIRLEAMKAENQQRLHRGESLAYVEADFDKLIDEYQLGHNSVVSNLNNLR